MKRHVTCAVGQIAVAALICVACTSHPPADKSSGSTPSAHPPSSSGIKSEEQQEPRPASSWRIRRTGSIHDIEGWADHTSVEVDEPFRLFVSTTAPFYRVRAFRMGWYGGSLGRLLWTSRRLPGSRQPDGVLARATNTVTAPWRPSLTVATTGWEPGMYLLRLDSSTRAQRFVPITVRLPSARGRVVLVNAVTTWQAYNRWGGYDLYSGPTGFLHLRDSFSGRARAVAFDRPYDNQFSMRFGGGEFLHRELPVLALAERLGLPLAYVTDIDLHIHPGVLDGARAIVFMGHDEYWSPEMRAALVAARDQGSNVAFFGANTMFRRIRLASTRTGPARLEINYKVATEDPLYGKDDVHVTADWPAPPGASPASEVTGVSYDCFPAREDMRVYRPSSWVFEGTGVSTGTRLHNLVGTESDRVDLDNPTPRPMEIVAHTPLNCAGRPTTSDAVYYTTPSGAGVFAAGTIDWVCAMQGCQNIDGLSSAIVRRVTSNILRAFAKGPAGLDHPAHDNVDELY
jgi:hypothetical protein